MHGRLKVKTTAEQEAEKQKEREKKVKLYLGGTKRVFEKRSNNELDEEGLELTGQLLAANPDFYTLWNFRREIFLGLKEKKSVDEITELFEKELRFLEQCLQAHPKSYGTWHHRGWILLTSPKPDWKTELQLCNKFLEYDERNFHCWDYRRFIVKQSAVPDVDEFEYTTNKINKNFSNFSSWHYRSKLLPRIHPDPDKTSGIKEEIMFQEFDLAQNAFFTDPGDQSAWFYNRWLLGKRELVFGIECMHVSRDKQNVLLVFSKTAQYGKDLQIELQVNCKTINCTWKSLNGESRCNMWVCYTSEIFTRTDTPDIKVNVNHVNNCQAQCSFTEHDQHTAAWKKQYKKGTRFMGELSAGTNEILTATLDSCQQLHEMEPENKWAILTIVSLMRTVDPLKYQTQTLEYIDKLINIDAGRHCYYRDLRSRFIIEHAIENLEEDATMINLSGRGLTTLYHLDCLATMKRVDLSSNYLRYSKDDLWELPCAMDINIDNNTPL